MNQAITSVLLLFSLGTIWGSGFVIAKFAILHDVSPLGYSFWQSIGPAILLLFISRVRKKLYFSKQHIIYYFICGLLGIAIPNTIMYLSAAHIPSGLLSVIVNIQPIIIYPLAILAQQEKLQLKRVLGIMIGLFGIMMMLIPKTTSPSVDILPWALLALVTPLSFAACSIYISTYSPTNSSPLSLSAGMLLFSAILLTPVITLFKGFHPITLPLTYGDYAILLEILLSSIGYVLLFTLLKKAGAVYYSLVGGIVCLTGLFWGYTIYNETLTFVNIIAVLCILTAITTLSFYSSKQKENI